MKGLCEPALSSPEVACHHEGPAFLSVPALLPAPPGADLRLWLCGPVAFGPEMENSALLTQRVL